MWCVPVVFASPWFSSATFSLNPFRFSTARSHCPIASVSAWNAEMVNERPVDTKTSNAFVLHSL